MKAKATSMAGSADKNPQIQRAVKSVASPMLIHVINPRSTLPDGVQAQWAQAAVLQPLGRY